MLSHLVAFSLSMPLGLGERGPRVGEQRALDARAAIAFHAMAGAADNEQFVGVGGIAFGFDVEQADFRGAPGTGPDIMGEAALLAQLLVKA